ncbi:MAG: hypothetical protein MJ231_00705, partial [bacterium]|nr:hypothetical protein [bacterium]
MGIEKLLLGTLKKALQSGKAVGAEVKITDVTKMLKEHPKAIGEEIGNLLGGKGKKATDVLSSLGGFGKAFEEIDKVAQKYPEAIVKVGAKQSKQGFTIAKFTVKNGDKEIMSSATSVSGLKEGKPVVKSKFTRAKDNTEMRSFVDGENVKITAEDNITAVNINGTVSPMNLSVNVGKKGE